MSESGTPADEPRKGVWVDDLDGRSWWLPEAVSFETLVGELAVFDSDYHTLALWAASKWAAVRRIPKGIA